MPKNSGKAKEGSTSSAALVTTFYDWVTTGANPALDLDDDLSGRFPTEPRSRESIQSLGDSAEAIPSPLPGIFDEAAKVRFSHADIQKSVEKRVKAMSSLPLKVSWERDDDLPLLDRDWVETATVEFLLYSIKGLFAQRDAAAAVTNDLGQAYHHLACLYERALMRTRQWEETAERPADVAAKDEQIDELIDERDELKDRVQFLSTKIIDAMTNNQTPRGSTESPLGDQDEPITTTEGGDNPLRARGAQKTAKIADPAKFTDGKDPKFTVWKAALLRKFKGNADLFPTEASKFGYTLSYIAGDAMECLEPYLDGDCEDPITTTEEVFETLQGFYKDPTELDKAKDEFHSLKMINNQDFREFCTQFVKLAVKAKIARAEWKREFNNRLTNRLRTGLIRDYLDASVSFDEFQQLGHQFALQFHMMAKDQKATGSTNKGRGGGTGSTGSGTTTTGTSTAAAKAGTPGKSPSPEETEKLRAEDKCFFCRQVGHRKVDCPKRIAASIRRMQTKQASLDRVPEETSAQEEQGN